VRALCAAGDVECEGIGGMRMAEAGMQLHCDLASSGIMGFVEVLRSLRFIRNVFNETLQRLKQRPPDCLVLIDYPGFNMRLAAKAKKMGIPVVYYISPQVWAWKPKRVYKIAAAADKVLVIFPFEKSLYEPTGVACEWVGHPLLDHIAATPVEGCFAGKCVIGLLPGSRGQEVQRLLPPMLEVARQLRMDFPDARFIAPCVDELRAQQIRGLVGDFPLEVVVGQFYEVLHAARFCLVASGTATLETALFNVPMVVMYKVAPLTYQIARRLVKTPYISLVNILAKRAVVPEFIQGMANPEVVVPVARELVGDTPRRSTMLADLAGIRAMLGEPGASRRAAEAIRDVVEKRNHAA